MKNTRFFPLQCIAVLALMMLITPLWAQTLHSGERSDDFTGIRRNMTPLYPTQCPDNQIPVGSNCVEMPRNTSSQTLPWTTLVPAETRCGIVNDGEWISYTGSSIRQVLDWRNFCVLMNFDGAGSVAGYNFNDYYYDGTILRYPAPGSFAANDVGPYATNPNGIIYTSINAYAFGVLRLTPTFSGSSVSGWVVGIYSPPTPPCNLRNC